MEATSNGLPSTRRMARGTASNTSQAMALTAIARGVVEFQRSTDGGVTWQAPIDIPNEPTIGTLDVDTNGNLFIGGEGFNTFYCVRSSNAQIGGQTPTFDQVTQVNMGGDLVFGGGINPGGLAGQAVPGD